MHQGFNKRVLRVGALTGVLAGALTFTTGMGAAQQTTATQKQSAASKSSALPEFTDFAVTYTAERAKLAPSTGSYFWLNGASGDAAATFYKGLGVAANLTVNHASNITPGVNLSQTTFVIGPRYTLDTSRFTDGRLTKNHATYLFAESLFGVVHGFGSVFPTNSGVATSASAFAMQLGGGANVALSRGFGLRLFELDYVRTTLPNNGSNSQNDLRLAFGVSYHLQRW
ncbi:MAG: hypothetical protein HIU91_16150 [Acidobacteria bacterium]|nr:hypothetical protein [Acidobacteriota bacterium]